MRNYTRRRVLATSGAAALAGTVIAPKWAAAEPASDREMILANTHAIFAGTIESNSDPAVSGRLDKITTAARSRLKALDAAGDGELFKGQPLGTSDPNLSKAFGGVYDIALATRIPPGADGASDLHDNRDVQQRVIDGLLWLHENYYGDQEQGYYGNWFHWEIGISTFVTKTLVLLKSVLDETPAGAELMQTYVASMDAYLRSGKDGDVDLDSRFHTGANLADITTNRIIQGALLDDEPRITKAISDELTVFETIDPYNLQHGVTDGHYADGSFIQHDSVAYTGSYGKVLLGRVVQMIKILDGTTLAPGADLAAKIFGWVSDGFAPLIFEGWMMEVVKGRAISRPGTGYADVADVIEAAVDLSEYSSDNDSLALKGYVKQLRSTSRAALDPSSFVSPLSIVRYAKIIEDSTIPEKDLTPARHAAAFNAMDKTVHRRPGFAFALARSSDRISKYEYMSGDNLLPWFQGDGASYLYLAGQDQTEAYGIDYLTAVEPDRLAGVTAPVEERKSVPDLYDGALFYDNPDHPLNFTSSSESQNAYVYFPRGTNVFSGGATLDAYAVSGMVQSDDVAYRDKIAGLLPDDFVAYQNAEATKSWFLLDDEIVILAAGLHDPAGRDLVTSVDSRIAAADDEVSLAGELVNGKPWSGANAPRPEPGTSLPPAELSWLQWHNVTQDVAVGYVFLDTPRIRVKVEEVERSRRVVRVSNPDTMIKKQVLGVTIDHQAGRRDGSLAYVMLPNATEEMLRSSVADPIEVLTNTPRAQAIHHRGLGLTAANVFADRSLRVGALTVTGPASVIVIEGADGSVSVSVSDPTMNRSTIAVRLRVGGLTPTSADDGVRVTADDDGVSFEVDTHHAYGRSFTAHLNR